MGFIGFSLVLRGCIRFCFGGFLGYSMYAERHFALFFDI